MNTDIRLSVGFWQHPKTKKLARRLGLEAVRSLQILWLWAAQNRPDGNLSGMDWEDIELAADWQGEEQAFFTACLGAFLDETDGGFVLHDWTEHNPWQAESEARSDAARKAALARWGNAPASEAQCAKNAPASKTHMRKQCARNAPASDAQCPSPFPSKKNINTYTPPVDYPVNEDPARSPERPTGGDGERPPVPDGDAPAVDLDGPGLEFVELRDAYNAVRPEGPLAGFPEYKQLKAARDRTGRSRYPGNARLIDDFTRRKDAGFWNPGYALGLAQYLKTRLWEQPVKARAAPAQPPGGNDGGRPTRTHKERMAILQAAEEGAYNEA